MNETIKNYRILNRISQAALAKHLGFERSHICQIEAGMPIKPEKAKRIIRAINDLCLPIPESLQAQIDEIMGK